MSPAGKSLEVGTRKSKLALVQTDTVVASLQKSWPAHQFNIRARDTAAGDMDKVTPFKDMPVKNLWTHDLEKSLMDGELDLLVHSLKDVPTQIPPPCHLGAILEREDPRDAFVLKAGREPCTIAELPPGSVIGTSSIRRTAQIALKHPHLKVLDVRGNVPTRLRKLDDEGLGFDALILAAAGLIRLGLQDRISQLISSTNGGMLYAVGQGAIGVESRSDDSETNTILAKIDHSSTSLACIAERSLLRRLEGGCSAPLGVETQWDAEGSGRVMSMKAIVVSVDGKESAEIEMSSAVSTVTEAEEFGKAVADALAAKGADKILAAIQAKKATEPIDLQD